MRRVRRAAGYLQVLRNKPFMLLWSGQIVSQAGDAIYAVALFWLMTQICRSPAMLGYLGMAESLPVLLFGLIAGAIVDRYERRRLMILCDLVRAAVLAAATALYFMGGLLPWHLLAAAFVLATFTRVFNPARQAVVRQVAPLEVLHTANALSSATQEALNIVGPPLAGVILAVSTAGTVFALNGLSFLVSAAFLGLLVRYPLQGVEPAKQTPFLKSIVDGLKFVATKRWLVVYTPLETLFMFLWVGPWVAGLPLFVKGVLQAGSTAFGLILGINSAGFILGSIIYGQFPGRIPKSLVVIWSGLTSGLFLIVFVLTRGLPLPALAAIFFIQGLLAGPGPVAYVSMLQAMVPSDKLGRVFSTVSVLNGLATPASFGLVAVLMDRMPVTTVWIGAGALILLIYGPMTLLNRQIINEEYETALASE
ncbi:MAG: MFS transporter [Acetobacteraceae bacterium]|nr:MFS transporter [Acetobacteraceae bacterium]